MLNAIWPAHDHPAGAQLLPLPGLSKIEDGRIAHAFIGEPLVPFVPGSRRKGLGQETFDRVLSRTPWLSTEWNKVRSPKGRQEVLYKVHLCTRENNGATVGRPVDVVESGATVEAFLAQIRGTTFSQDTAQNVWGPGH